MDNTSTSLAAIEAALHSIALRFRMCYSTTSAGRGLSIGLRRCSPGVCARDIEFLPRQRRCDPFREKAGAAPSDHRTATDATSRTCTKSALEAAYRRVCWTQPSDHRAKG